ncbi:arylamine N-acetyltransferase [Falsibacillus albus]|uniref:Arylamine N-acetyltransferase n=1 Tax=Falsibacillus albus TaxID=2478915 RepID=A0A3L7JUH6_9BACI|nr:arylamine N-acetyltransferase [Falsibacillus albus]RLQ93759.1 arylamine N-acetyltransferase [Falsibacillus albus]
MNDTINQYLNCLRIGVESPSLNYLQRLIQQHLFRVPYETFSKFHYYSIDPRYVPSLDIFVQNLTEKGWGGTCFTLNINFARLLKALQFDCHLVRVKPGHLALMVILGSKKFYADVGYGSPIMKPIELEAKRQHTLHGFGEDIIFTQKSKDIYEVDRRANGKSFVRKEIEWKPLTEEDIINDIECSYLDDDENQTMRRITAVRFNGHECYFLRDHSLKVMTYRNISEINLQDIHKWKKYVQEVYKIDENSLDESIRFLKQRGVSLF